MDQQNNDTSQNIPESGKALSSLPGEHVRLLLDTIEGINHTTEFKSVLTESMEATRLVMNTEASSLYLMDEEDGELFISLPTGPAKKEVLGKTIPKNKGIAGWVAENKRPYLINDVTTSEHFFGDIADEFTTRNILCIPLISRENKLIGVLQAINRKKESDFTPHDIPVFQALGSHISVAIERTRHIDGLHYRLKMKDAALTQIHHRIAESFREIQGLVDEELASKKDTVTKEVLQKVRARIEKMSQMYAMLREEELDSRIDLGFYLAQLSERINEMIKPFGLRVEVTGHYPEINIRQERALLCGLILNELLINVYKHSIVRGDETRPCINVAMAENNGEVKILVSDEGLTLPESLDLNKKQSIGLWLIDDLIKKLNGTIAAVNREDARFVIDFTAEPMDEDE